MRRISIIFASSLTRSFGMRGIRTNKGATTVQEGSDKETESGFSADELLGAYPHGPIAYGSMPNVKFSENTGINTK